jgi:hypothetical protein
MKKARTASDFPPGWLIEARSTPLIIRRLKELVRKLQNRIL